MSACAWSAENATKAFLHTFKMVSGSVSCLCQGFTYLILVILQGKREKEPNVAEFIAAFAAGKSAQFMVMACEGCAGSASLALGAAAHQTGGRAVCILKGHKELQASRKALGQYADSIEFITGNVHSLLLNDYQDADFVLIDCKMDDHKQLLQAAQKGLLNKNAVLVGYNANHCNPWMADLKAHFLPIGEGLLVTRTVESEADKFHKDGKKSRWVVEIDKLTGEEHVYRVTSPKGSPIS